MPCSTLLRRVGLEGFERRRIGKVPVGELQRVPLPTCWQKASVAPIDETFRNAVDARSTAKSLAMIHRGHAEGRSMIVIQHAFEPVRAHFNETLLFARDGILGPDR